MKFCNTIVFLQLYEIEQLYLKLAEGILKEIKFERNEMWYCKEMGRYHGFIGSANLISDTMHRNDRLIERKYMELGKKKNVKR
jgi:hypothetical protein